MALIIIATGLSYTYSIIEASNTSPALLDFIEMEPQENIVNKVFLKGENEVSILHGVREEIPIMVSVTTENGELVAEFEFSKNYVFVFENPFSSGEFIVSTTNLGDQTTDVYLSIKDVKEEGTYIDTFDAYWTIVPLALILGVIGGVILAIGVIMSLVIRIREKRKASQNF